jgi:flagellar motor switch protein FliN
MSVQIPVPLDARSALLRSIWVDSFRSVLGQVAGFAVTVEPGGEDEPVAGAPAVDKPEVWTLFAASKSLHGEMAILSTEDGALQLSQVLMSEPPDLAVPFDPGRREAYQELLNQVAGQVATGVKSAAEGEVEIKLSGKNSPEWQNATRTGIRIGGEKFTPFRLFLVVSAELAGSFQAPQEESVPAVSNAEEASTPLSALSAARNSNLELLLDVTLDTTICFGQKQMLLRDILELHPGVAITLDRQVDEPVDLLVGGRLVARGEVVMVDGNYGLRITEIISPQQRAATLGVCL